MPRRGVGANVLHSDFSVSKWRSLITAARPLVASSSSVAAAERAVAAARHDRRGRGQ